MAQIQADEIARLLRDEIEHYEKAVNVSETGSVISVGDGIARVYGLENVMAGEMVELFHEPVRLDRPFRVFRDLDEARRWLDEIAAPETIQAEILPS